MSWIVLAAGLGVANFIAVVLLFRRLRGDLNRQLRDMRAERNSELILHALRGVPEEQEQAAQVANGSRGGLEPSPGGPQPVRRKRHLGLFIGGGVAALVVTLGQVLRDAWQTRRWQVVGTAVGVAAAATTVVLMAYQPWEDGDGRTPPSSAPTAEPSATRPPGYTQPPPNSPRPSGPAPNSPSPSRSGTEPNGTATPGGSATTRPSATKVPSVDPSGRRSAPPPSRGQWPSDGEPPPGRPPSTAPDPPPPTGKQPPARPPASCALAVGPVLGIRVCLLGGGGG